MLSGIPLMHGGFSYVVYYIAFIFCRIYKTKSLQSLGCTWIAR